MKYKVRRETNCVTVVIDDLIWITMLYNTHCKQFIVYTIGAGIRNEDHPKTLVESDFETAASYFKQLCRDYS